MVIFVCDTRVRHFNEDYMRSGVFFDIDNELVGSEDAITRRKVGFTRSASKTAPASIDEVPGDERVVYPLLTDNDCEAILNALEAAGDTELYLICYLAFYYFISLEGIFSIESREYLDPEHINRDSVLYGLAIPIDVEEKLYSLCLEHPDGKAFNATKESYRNRFRKYKLLLNGIDTSASLSFNIIKKTSKFRCFLKCGRVTDDLSARSRACTYFGIGVKEYESIKSYHSNAPSNNLDLDKLWDEYSSLLSSLSKYKELPSRLNNDSSEDVELAKIRISSALNRCIPGMQILLNAFERVV